MEAIDPFYNAEEESRALKQSAVNSRTRDLFKTRRSSEETTTLKRKLESVESAEEFIKVSDGSENARSGFSGSTISARIPWAPTSGYPPYRNCFLRLHQEIIDFVRWVSLNDAEQESRETFLHRLNGVCKSIWHRAKVVPFGSFLTNLSLPSSDVDVSIVNVPPERGDETVSSIVVSLRRLANALLEQQQVSFVELRETAKIPILRVRDIYPPHCEFDINMNPESSPQGTSKFVIENAVKEFPAFRPLVMVLKCFLNQRSLGETFTGGVGSYLLSCLVLGFLQQARLNSSWSRSEELTSLGHLLFDFFNFYAREFRVDKEGLSVRRSGSKFLKSSRNFELNRNGGGSNKRFLSSSEALCVESPLEPHLDIGNKVFQWKVARSAFMQARQYLIDEVQQYDPSDAKKSLLSPALIDPFHEMFARFERSDIGHSEDLMSCPLSGNSALTFLQKSMPVPITPFNETEDLPTYVGAIELSDDESLASDDGIYGETDQYYRKDEGRYEDRSRRDDQQQKSYYRKSSSQPYYRRRHSDGGNSSGVQMSANWNNYRRNSDNGDRRRDYENRFYKKSRRY